METENRLDIIFDLDGTLVDSCGGIARSLAFAYRSTGASMPDVDMRPLIGPSIDKIISKLSPGIDEGRIRDISTVYRQHYDSEGWRDTTLYSEAEAVLKHLSKYAPLYIVTNKPHKPTRLLIENLQLNSLFCEIVSKDSRDPPFASKASMLEVLQHKRGLDASKTVLVGDTEEDYKAALHVGMQFVWASYGYGDVPAAQYKITSLPQLQGMIERNEI